MTSDPASGAACGFVYAATGARYVQMARHSAWSLRRHHPDLPIDLFTDMAVSDPVFDRIHPVDSGTRPKMEALRRSRFARTLCIDTDTIIVAPIPDVFALLDRCDILGAQDPLRNSAPARRGQDPAIPPAFPQINSGVLGIRASDATETFLIRWAEAFHQQGAGVDQPALRSLLWETPALRLGILPVEYNFWDLAMLDAMTPLHAAPRVLHSFRFGQPRVMALADPASSEPMLLQALGRARHRRLVALLEADGTIPGHDAPPATENRFGPGVRRRIRMGRAIDLARKLPHKLGIPWP